MSTTDIEEREHGSTDGASERCGQCGAPATHEQRYCVRCGFHRRNAPDPVSRYLSEASAARTAVIAATAAMARGRARRLGVRTVSMLVALALVAGILIGSMTTGTTGSKTSRNSPSTAKAGPKATRTHRHSGTKLRNATGSSYMNQEQNLPNSVTP